MSKLIALKSGSHEILPDALNGTLSNLKQQVLLFDQIGILDLSRFYRNVTGELGFLELKGAQNLFQENRDPSYTNKIESMISELEWLREMGIVFELNPSEEFPHKIDEAIEEEVSVEERSEIASVHNKIRKDMVSFSKQSSELIDQIIKIRKDMASFSKQSSELIDHMRLDIDVERLKTNLSKLKKELDEIDRKSDFATLRISSIIMRIIKEITTVTTLSYLEYTDDFSNSQKNDVAHIVINKLPLPNYETPWEQIIDFRNDPDNQKSRLALRRWILKISNEELSKAEIEEEIEWLINEFQEHMKYHKLKANTETLEVLVKAPLEIIEDLVRLKFSKIPEPFFALKKRQLMLMEAEINAPGKEMAYIIKSREAFSPQQ